MYNQINILKPQPALQPYIKHYMEIAHDPVEGLPSALRLPPDGDPRLFYHQGAPLYFELDGRRARLSEGAFFGGQLRRFATMRPSGRGKCFAIVFQPAGWYALLGAVSPEFAFGFQELEAALGAKARYLQSIIRYGRHFADCVRHVEVFFADQLDAAGGRMLYAHHAAAFIRRRAGQVAVGEVARKMGIGERQLEREFKDKIGLGPKTFIRIARINHVFELLKNHPNYSWAELAYEAGYADQAHFVNDFRAFTGKSPTCFFARRAASIDTREEQAEEEFAAA
jgi:AraC-like DNA-binding protein